MAKLTPEEISELTRRATEMWRTNATWHEMPVREVCLTEELFVAYFVGMESGKIKHFGGVRAGWSEDAAHETQRSVAENLERAYAGAANVRYDEITDVTERAQAMWDANAVYRGEKVRDEFLNVKLLASYLKALDSGAKHIIHPTNG